MSNNNRFQQWWNNLPSFLQVVGQILAALVIIIPSGRLVKDMLHPPIITELCSQHKGKEVKCRVTGDKEVTINIINKTDQDVRIEYEEWQSKCGVSGNDSRNRQSIPLSKREKEKIRMYAPDTDKNCREAFIFDCNDGKDNCYELLEVTIQWKKE
jgi:hypothetical protein